MTWVVNRNLAEGDDYTGLRPTISICFVNGVLFADRPEHHTLFRLLDATGQLCLTNDLDRGHGRPLPPRLLVSPGFPG